jgi:hypothetical protein
MKDEILDQLSLSTNLYHTSSIVKKLFPVETGYKIFEFFGIFVPQLLMHHKTIKLLLHYYFRL